MCCAGDWNWSWGPYSKAAHLAQCVPMVKPITGSHSHCQLHISDNLVLERYIFDDCVVSKHINLMPSNGLQGIQLWLTGHCHLFFKIDFPILNEALFNIHPLSSLMVPSPLRDNFMTMGCLTQKKKKNVPTLIFAWSICRPLKGKNMYWNIWSPYT